MALGVGGVAGGVFAVQRSVVAKLRALVSVAPAELLGLGFEEGRAVGLVVCGLAVVVVFALESESCGPPSGQGRRRCRRR